VLGLIQWFSLGGDQRNVVDIYQKKKSIVFQLRTNKVLTQDNFNNTRIYSHILAKLATVEGIEFTHSFKVQHFTAELFDEYSCKSSNPAFNH